MDDEFINPSHNLGYPIRLYAGAADEPWLPTMPGTLLEFSVPVRRKPCWRCRWHLRWPPWRRHWQCRKLPPITSYVELPDANSPP